MSPYKKLSTWPELTAILLARLVVLWLIVLLSLLLPSDDIAFYTFMGIAFIITIPYSLWLRNRLRSLEFAPLQFIVDLVLVTGLIYFTGGIRSDFTLLYPLVILCSGIVGTPKQAMGITMMAISTYMLMALMLHNNLLAEYASSGSAMPARSEVLTITSRAFAFAFFGGASIYVAKRCDYINTHERTLETTTAVLLESIPVPALLLSQEGAVLFANEPAGVTLKTTREALCTRTFSDLRHAPDKPIPEAFGHTAMLLRENAAPLPVAYRTMDFQILDSALFGAEKGTDTPVPVTLLVFNDISRELQTRRQLEKVERITNATRIAGEMAHEIQAPLAALSASLELLKHYEAKATAADWLPNSPRRKDRMELFDHIEDASTKMNSTIRNFIDFAEFSPQDLLSIIKLDSTDESHGYIGHLNTIGRGLRDGQNSHSG